MSCYHIYCFILRNKHSFGSERLGQKSLGLRRPLVFSETFASDDCCKYHEVSVYEHCSHASDRRRRRRVHTNVRAAHRTGGAWVAFQVLLISPFIQASCVERVVAWCCGLAILSSFTMHRAAHADRALVAHRVSIMCVCDVCLNTVVLLSLKFENQRHCDEHHAYNCNHGVLHVFLLVIA